MFLVLNFRKLLIIIAALIQVAFAAVDSYGAEAVFTKISAGGSHTIALKSDGSLWAWGNDNHGQLGSGINYGTGGAGSNISVSLVPIPIGTGYSLISAGYEHSLAIRTDGSLWVWGRNNYHQLGDGTDLHRYTPKQIIPLGVASVSAGQYHSVALMSDSRASTWGMNLWGQLGSGSQIEGYSPNLIGAGFISLASGYNHTLAIKSDGGLWAWGRNDWGQLGDGNVATGAYDANPTPKLIASEYTAVAAGGGHSIAIKSNGTLWAWGNNEYGQLGDGTNANSSTPKQIGTDYIAIAAGFTHTLAIKSDGSLWAWGANPYGQLGDGSTQTKFVPTWIGTGFSAVSAGEGHSVALKSDGTLWAWGRNSNGQIGDGTSGNVLVPKQSGITDLIAPSIPTSLSVVATGTTTTSLQWMASSDNFGVASYKIYRNGLIVGGSTTTSYNDSLLTPSTVYGYTVVACDASKNCSAQSAAVRVTTSAPPPPPRPISVAECLSCHTSAAVKAHSDSNGGNSSTPFCMPCHGVGTDADELVVHGSPTLNFVSGWNLVGNSVSVSLDVATKFASISKVNSVWKWIPERGRWAFFSPSMVGQSLTDYINSKGYDVLTAINGGEGFWVNAKTSFTVKLPTGTVVTSSTFQGMASGWRLISIGKAISASNFNNDISSSPPAAGVIPQNITTLWAWDKATSKWYFYAPSLDAQGGTALSDYIASKGYLNFTTVNKTLGPGVGFWVNKQ